MLDCAIEDLEGSQFASTWFPPMSQKEIGEGMPEKLRVEKVLNPSWWWGRREALTFV